MINEPTPSPSEEGTAVSRSSSSALRFMESRHSLLSMHWDHEVAASGGGAAVPAAIAGVSPAMDSGARRPSGRRDACPTTVRFKERSKFAAVSARSVAMERPKDEARNGAFTLIELLVAIAVIGIVAALLLPALARAKERSRQAACLSNLRQIGLAFSLYLGDHEDRFADRRDLKSSLGYKPWNDWPKSDPRGAWASVVLSNQLSQDRVWVCPTAWVSSLRSTPQLLQASRPGDTNSVVSYWLWRFDRPDDPVPLDNFWGKTPEQSLHDLREANNPTAGQPDSQTEVELADDPYFPNTIPALPPALRGRAMHARGRNSLMLDGHAAFVRDLRLN